MIKLKASKKEIKENSYRVLSVGYCDAQYLLRGVEPFSYCSGVYGWRCDNYEINNGHYSLIISTGYDPIKDQGINKKVLKNKYDIIQKYENKAKKINCSGGTWAQTQKKLNKLLYNFIDEICKNEEA